MKSTKAILASEQHRKPFSQTYQSRTHTLSMPKSKVSISEMNAKQGIFLKATYTNANSKRFIKIRLIQFSAKQKERRRLPSQQTLFQILSTLPRKLRQ
jgi:hypothetical protein